MKITYRHAQGPELENYIDAISDLRITVFKEFPYIYDGNKDYERKYLQRYIDTKNSLVVLAFHEDKLVGASTCLPMKDEEEAFQRPFKQKSFALDKVFYFGESIVLKEYRGNKIGHQFFTYREEHALKSIEDLRFTTFCAVQRPVDHPLRPDGYRDLSEFWQRMGYVKTELKTQFHWKDIDKTEEDAKTMVFWVKEFVK